MPNPRRVAPAILLIFLGLISSSCVFTRRVILRHGKKVTPGTAPILLTATRDELDARLSKLYNAINSFQAKAELTPSVGSVNSGQITEIRDVSAYILFRKPADIRIIADTPVIGTRAFDMVSNGANFRLYLVSKSLFIEGADNAPAVSKNKLENLRPDAFLSSMLIRPADPATEFPMMEDFTDEENAFYILNFVKKAPDGSLALARTVWFDRIDLTIVRQMVFQTAGEMTGEIVSDTRYSKWQFYGGVMFPSQIDINRVQDGYGLVIDVLEMKMNIPLTDDKFLLGQPEGTKLQVVGAPK